MNARPVPREAHGPRTTALPCHLALLCGALAIAAPAAAVPLVSHDLRLGPAQTAWFAAAYQLGCGPLQLGAGRIADRYGPRRVLLSALAVFTAGSLLAAAAVGGPWLVGARLMQGAGGSALSPVSLTLLLQWCPGPEAEPRAVAGWVSTAGVASCLGPLLGGSLAALLGWRAVFGALAALAAFTFRRVHAGPADRPRDSQEAGGDDRSEVPGIDRSDVPGTGRLDALGTERSDVPGIERLDAPGIVLCTGTAGAVVVGLTAPAAQEPALAVAAAGAVAVLLPLAVHRARQHVHSALDVRLLREAPSRRALLVLLILFAANSAFTYLLYFALARGHGLGPFRAALVMLPAALPAVVAGRLAARRTGRGAGPALMRGGLLLMAAGLLTGCAGRHEPTPLWLTGCACALVGCGLGLANGAAMATVTGCRDRRRTSAAVATATAFAMAGGAAGPAVAGAVLTAVGELVPVCGAPACVPRGPAPAAAAASGDAGAGPYAAVGVHVSLSLLGLATAAAALTLAHGGTRSDTARRGRRPGPNAGRADP
ncbi:MFS transporter [Streptomyces rectiverticillatus]|uniref:MFS transporter n=1 Tax=Streptomyces rectiverticillatus TaxID=173860 RepID=UPI0015C35A46|nr:MFS transporter [Streptomyces rectiverticillatus]